MKKVCALLLVLAMASAASAAPIFCDDFDSYTDAFGRNWDGGGVWTISDGTVDLIPYTDGRWDFIPGNGRYIDLDGSTGDAGVMSVQFDLAPGSYLLKFDLAGNHRSGSDTAVVAVDFGGFWSTQYTLSANDPFQTYEQVIHVSEAVTASLSFAGVGGDNAGLLLDDVCVSVVPAPGALLLGSLGCGLVGWLRRRGI